MTEQELTGSLEDYLETIYELRRDRHVIRVKHIAAARGVRAASVTPAMRRLADMGMIRYEQREYIELTSKGEAQARRVFSRHQLLKRFFVEILGMPEAQSECDACAMEHKLSAEGMDRLVRFFEFLHVCPEGRDLMQMFHGCSRVHGDLQDQDQTCGSSRLEEHRSILRSMADMKRGERAHVAQIDHDAPERQSILDKGILPNVEFEVTAVSETAEDVEILLDGDRMSLSRPQAEAVRLLETGVE